MGFGDEFIDRVLRWSIPVAAIGGIVGWLISAEVVTAFAVWIGAAVDITSFRWLAMRGRRAIAGDGALGPPATALLARLGAKAALLVVAMVLPWSSALWGVVGGVLVVETMLVILGVFDALRGALRHGNGTGREVKS
jgi:hypothetical protein